ncbi:hypothetical protein KO48_000859 [Salmonella enterica subsp. enterica serovar Bredeney]|nr:hypothetical protein [Salmonella enterica subsp. enterica serovar Bredeney]
MQLQTSDQHHQTNLRSRRLSAFWRHLRKRGLSHWLRVHA